MFDLSLISTVAEVALAAMAIGTGVVLAIGVVVLGVASVAGTLAARGAR